MAENPAPQSAWDVVFAAVITKTVTAPARYYFKDTDRDAALEAFTEELKTDYGASEVKILKFEEVPLDDEWTTPQITPPPETLQ